MSKAVLISIRPKWCEMIASGKKTIEVRKTAPKIETPFKCYIYCTNNGDTLYSVNGKVQPCNSFEINLKENSRVSELNGYVIGEFVCDEIKTIDIPYPAYWTERHKQELDGSCLTLQKAHNYLGHDLGYGWHISELVVYDEPKPLTDFHKPVGSDCCKKCGYWEQEKCYHTAAAPLVKHCKITRPPQSYKFAEELP